MGHSVCVGLLDFEKKVSIGYKKMQTRRFHGASHIGYMQRYLESRFEDTVETKWDVSEEMMGLEFLLAMQAIVRKNASVILQNL